ncbi:MAG: A24 family peptidase [Dethiosulfatibacter sp.]|nr:A24 family peptidase [Dethiosulfatibacter sp.]
MAITVFVFGLLIGLFLNFLIYIIPKDEIVAWHFSLRSFLFECGQYECCNWKTNLQSIMVVLSNGIVYLLIYLRFYHIENLDFIFYSLISSCLIVITSIDLKEQIIPDSLVLSIFGLSVLHKTFLHFLSSISFPVLDSLLGLILAGLLFVLIVVFSGGGMGEGDVTLISALGFVVGLRMIFLVIFFSFILGALISIFLLGTGLKTRKDPIPFGPFIVLGYFIVIFRGEEILRWYISLLT